MKRSGPPEHRTGLSSDPTKFRAWQQRSRRRLPARSAKRVEDDHATAWVRQAVAARPCLLRATPETGPCSGAGTPHHLEKAWRGRNTTPENLVPLCAAHNRWVEDEPKLAKAIGLVVAPGIDPAEARRRRIAAGLDIM